MSDTHSRRNRSYYRALVSHLLDGTPWTHVDDGTDPAESFQRAADESASIGELILTHLHTDAELYLSLPDHRDGKALRAVLYHPLDRRMEQAEEGFISDLARSHEQIAREYQCQYLEPVADPTVVLRASIPFDYSVRRVSELMTAITTVALRVQRLHWDIRAPLGEVLSRQVSPSAEVTYRPRCQPNKG